MPNSAYVNAIDRVQNKSLEFCLIDGAARDHCALASLPKLKPGGILVIDNANWYLPSKNKSHSPHSRCVGYGYASPTWQSVGEQLASWRHIWTTNGITDSALWVRPLE
jgi:hypothetical protein